MASYLRTIPCPDVGLYLAPILFEIENPLQEKSMLLICPTASQGLLLLTFSEVSTALNANSLESLEFWRLIIDREFLTKLVLKDRHFKLVVLIVVRITLDLNLPNMTGRFDQYKVDT